ncbi:ARM repeat superfamily protein [Perilla frutescens var. hirtella]|uniref:ARM repeat superfamily protein n=1 Tax=Perilla frutescens var. hirtella TaxID=608512 RepID=A0AAD4J2V7_PERFH|nr:ARM repeat superfamily protein [Perilla frutescens var. hirtella]
MAPAKAAARKVSQQAFDEMVQENIEDLGMDPAEALNDAIQTLTLQGVDLSGIVTCAPGESNPVMECLGKFGEDKPLSEIVEILDELSVLCRDKGSGNAAIAAKNGAVELIISACAKLRDEHRRGLASGLRALASVIHDLQSTEIFKENGGPEIVVGILSNEREDVKILDSCFSVVTAAATGNEVLKELFMDLKMDELIFQILKERNGASIPSTFDAIHVILSSDDNRVVASQVFGYARKFSKSGIAGVLVDSLREGLSSPCLISASIALKSIAVNDEICRSISQIGGIDVILRCVDDSGVQGNSAAAKALCSLLSKVAGSDVNKNIIVEKGGMDKLVNLSARFSDDPLVLQEVMSIITTLCLRSPNNAARAIESGAGDLAIQAMDRFPQSDQLQRSSCFMIRNLVVRNPENRKLLLANGIEQVIRRAKQSHKSCKDAATDALRDLGLDNYNS